MRSTPRPATALAATTQHAATQAKVERLESRRLLTVSFAIDASQSVHPISRYIYGVNQALSGSYSNATLERLSGNRWTAYNWENNASNAGNDYIYQNDDYLGGGATPGGAVIPTLTDAANHNAAALVTVPINGYVAADKNGGGDVHNSGANYLQTRFKQELPRKGSAYSLTPDTADAYVYADEFVNWLKTNYGYGQTDPNKPIWFSLDNEPDLWASTHAEVHPSAVTYAELRQKTIDYASAIKDVSPNAVVFGPVSYGWNGFTKLQDAPDAGGRDFLTYYLQQMSQAQTAAGRRLVDVLDLHWYPEASGTNGIRITSSDASPATVAARLQAPRSLWDSTYTEKSWITQYSTLGPINLLPREQAKINANYPGTKLAITEYNYGGGADISGGIAQADVLGIFGREGLFAASEWPLSKSEAFIGGAFRMFRNYDGSNSTFGDTSIAATTSDNAASSIYASIDSATPNLLTLVAINKTNTPLQADMNLSNLNPAGSGSAYQLTSATSTPVSAGTVTISNPAHFSYIMPGYSVTTLRIPLVAPPTVKSAAYEYQTVPRKLSFLFSKDVSASLSSADLVVTPAGGGSAISVSYAGSDANFKASFVLPSALADGNYTATLSAAGITDGSGVALASNFGFPFFVLTADANHSGKVDSADFTLLAGHFNQTGTDYTQGDFNGDGRVNLLDFNALATHFGATPADVPLAAALSVPTAPTTANALPAQSSFNLHLPMRQVFDPLYRLDHLDELPSTQAD